MRVDAASAQAYSAFYMRERAFYMMLYAHHFAVIRAMLIVAMPLQAAA